MTLIDLRKGPIISVTPTGISTEQGDVVSAMTSVIDPLATTPVTARRLIVGAWHDQMAMRSSALAMQDRWGGELHWHDGSHVGHLFSGGVQQVTERFLSAA